MSLWISIVYFSGLLCLKEVYQLRNQKMLMHSVFSKASDIGQVWGWGYGGEGQLGLGSRIRTVSSPHPIPCIESAAYGKDRSPAITKGNKISEGQSYKVTGSCIKAIACGGRHSAVVTGANCWPCFC